jgi:hypothetical protein
VVDYIEFKDVLAEVRTFVSKGLKKYQFELTEKVVLHAKAPRKDLTPNKINQRPP